MENGHTNRKLAVFFDYENIVYSLRNRFEQKANFEALIKKCHEMGQVVAAQAFADWSLPHISSALLYALQSSGFDLIFVPTGSTQINSPRKNVADLYLTIHVMETLYTRPDIDTYVLLTGDRDFMPLVNVLQRNNKRVVAVGVDGSSSYYLTQAVDEFYYYSEVEEIFAEQPKPEKGRLTNIYDALVQTIQILQEKGKPPTLAHIKPQMSELMGGFDESNYTDEQGRPFQKFKDFVMEARRRGVVQVAPRGSGIEVKVNTQSKPRKSEPQQPPIPAVVSNDGRLTIDIAFDLLVRAVQMAQTEGKSFRASSVKNLMVRLNNGFSEGDIEDKSYGRFSDFVRDAAHRDLVEVRGSGAKMEIRPLRNRPNVETNRPEQPTELYNEDDIKVAILDALRGYRHYPVSFLSLASHCHKWLERKGIRIDETMTRTLLTETVELGLVDQSKRSDGKRQYVYREQEALIQQYLDVAMGQAGAYRPPTPPASPTPIEQLDITPDIFDDISIEPEPKLEPESKPKRSRRKTTKLEPKTKPEPEKKETKAKGKATAKPEPKAEPAVDDSPLMVSTDKAAEFETFERVPEAEEKQLMVEALRRFEGFPAPFMGILAFCRTVRDEKKVYLPNGPLRELLSDASRVNLIRPVTGRDERPTKYDFFDTEEALTAYLGDASTVKAKKVKKADKAETKDAEDGLLTLDELVADVSNVVDVPDEVVVETPAAPEPEAEATPETVEPVADVTAPAESKIDQEVAGRPILIDALRSYTEYPDEFKNILAHACALRDERKVDVSTDKLRSLLSKSARSGVLEITTPRGVRPTKYAFTGDEEAIKTYLDDVPKPVEPVVVKAETKAETKAEAETAQVEIPLVAEPEPVPAEPEAPAIAPEHQLLMQAVQTVSDKDKATTYRAVKQTMQKIDATFDEKEFLAENGKPFKRFKEFVAAGVAAGVVTLDESGKTPRIHNVAVDDSASDENKDEAQADVDAPVADAPAESEGGALDGAYALLVQAVNEATAEGTSRRLTAVRSRMVKLNPEFDLATLESADGKSFKKLGDFVRSAADAGYIRLEGKGFSLEALPA